MGDLHCNPDKSAIQILKPNYYSLRDTRDETKEVLGEEYTMNDWDNKTVELKINDYEYHSQPTYALFGFAAVDQIYKISDDKKRKIYLLVD